METVDFIYRFTIKKSYVQSHPQVSPVLGAMLEDGIVHKIISGQIQNVSDNLDEKGLREAIVVERLVEVTH